jgi:hypothetical protein
VRGFLFKGVFIDMNKRLQYADLVKKLVSCENLMQLSDTVKEINEFNKKYSITPSSEEFKKFETVIGLMKIKLKHKHGITESKNYIISENQFKFIVESNKVNTLVSKYLDSQDWRTWDIGDGEFNVADGEFGRDLIRLRIQYSSTFPDHSFDVIYLDDRLVTKIINLFGLKNDDAIESIINWFNQTYNTELTIKDFEWMDNDEENDYVDFDD